MAESAQAKANRKRREQECMRARLRKWELGDVPNQRKYPKDHPWCKCVIPKCEQRKLDALERIVALDMRGQGRPQPQTHPWRETQYKGRGAQ